MRVMESLHYWATILWGSLIQSYFQPVLYLTLAILNRYLRCRRLYPHYSIRRMFSRPFPKTPQLKAFEYR